MDNPTILLPSTPRFLPKGHTRTASRSPTRPRLMDDMLADLSPATTLEAYTSVSGTLKASIEAASPTQRAFGIRAAIASKKIQEWTAELSAWPWPTNSSEGFETPASKRRKISSGNFNDHHNEGMLDSKQEGRSLNKEEYWGCLPAADVRRYESRIEEISEDMEDLNVEEIKSQVLDRHVLPRSRASSLSGPYMEASSSQSYTRMDDFTAVVTATVLQALPSLSRLTVLMDVWSVRLTVLRQVPPLMVSMEDAVMALRSGWKAIQTLEPGLGPEDGSSKASVVSRQDYEIMRDVLQEKVSKLGQELDHMLDTLEGRNDTLPEAWLDRMESIEQDYGEWVVCGERKVGEDEWAKESAARRLEQLRRSSSALVDSPLSDSQGESLVLEAEDKLDADPALSAALQTAGMVQTEATMPKRKSSADPTVFEIAIMEAQPKHSRSSLNDGPEDCTSPRQDSIDVPQMEESISQPTNSAKLTESSREDVKVEVPSSKHELSPRPSRAKDNVLSHQEDIVTDLSLLSDGAFEEVDEKEELMRFVDIPQLAAESPNAASTVEKNKFDAETLKIMTPVAARQILTDDGLPDSINKPSTPLESSPSRHSSPSSATWPAGNSRNESHHELPRTPPSSSEVPPLGHILSHSVRREAQPEVSVSPSPRPSTDFDPSLQTSHTIATPILLKSPVLETTQTHQNQYIEDFTAQHHESDRARPTPLTAISIGDQSNSARHSTADSKPTHINLPSSPLASASERKVTDNLSPDINSPGSTKGHNRGPSSASIISGYATSEPSPVIHEAEPTEYFRPVSPPIIAKLSDLSNVTSPTQSSFSITPVSAKTPDSEARWESEAVNLQGFSHSKRMSLDSAKQEYPTNQKTESESSGTQSRRRPISNDSVISVIRSSSGQGRTSQDGSVSSEVSTINERLNNVSSTPVHLEPPAMETVPRSWHSQFVSDYDGDSPSLGRARSPNGVNNYSPASSPPPPETPPSERRPLQLRKTPSFDPDSFDPDSPSTPGDPPALGNVELSPTPALSSPSKHSDDQLQQQISEILESIPARFRLTSEPNTTGTSSIKQTKKRISLNPFSRPASRAATPSFTLAPAYARNPRPRPQNGNPEIKLYHLSRSTGEAPIKLFVRLVGEHGERVMVRVGGGWADLGEYLKEYASHHGRRSDQPSKVEIQDLPPRVISTGSTASMSTLKNGTWNTSEASSPISRPGSRPGSVLGRPLSSLAIRKTRKSVGEEAREKAYRSPSTPLPPSFRSSTSGSRLNETPPSANSARSVSQMSWREEESSLGLAGPRSRKGEISAENAAWVESMKEKVRIASAEKEKKEKATFGDMGQVGATKRLFKRSG